MADHDDMEKRLAKTGAELFKELLRVYDVAEFEDYIKNGQWQDEQMRVDLQLVEAHRREAGASEPIPLSEVKMPVVPFMPGGGAPRPVAVVGSPLVGAPAQTGVGAVAELRLIALFVAKWKLDATRTKEKLSKLLPARRRYVIANFKTTETGEAATDALDKFIEECEKTNSWAAATAAAPKPVAVATASPVAVKRPLVAVAPAFDPNKRPRMVTPVAVRPAAGIRPVAHASPAAAALAARLAAQRPRAVSPAARPAVVAARPAWAPAVRPVTPRPVAPAFRPAVGPAVRPAYARLAVPVRPAVRPVAVPVRPAWGR